MGQKNIQRTLSPMGVFVALRKLCRQTSDHAEIGKEAMRLIHAFNTQEYSEGKIYGKWADKEVSVLTDVFSSEPDKDKAIDIAAERLNRERASVRNKAKALGLRR